MIIFLFIIKNKYVSFVWWKIILDWSNYLSFYNKVISKRRTVQQSTHQKTKMFTESIATLNILISGADTKQIEFKTFSTTETFIASKTSMSNQVKLISKTKITVCLN